MDGPDEEEYWASLMADFGIAEEDVWTAIDWMYFTEHRRRIETVKVSGRYL